jgi:hypothetical protein
MQKNKEVNMSKNREKFIQLAENRVTKAIKNLRLVGNLANKSNYSYNEEDAKKILKALEAEVKNVRRRFESTSSDEEIIFKL